MTLLEMKIRALIFALKSKHRSDENDNDKENNRLQKPND